MQTRNVSLKRDEMKSLGMKKTEFGKPIPSYEHSNPNRSQRRSHMQASHHNAKNTPGRKVQYAEVMVKRETKFGPVNEPTGFLRKIIHKIANARILRANISADARRMASQNPLKPDSNAKVAMEKATAEPAK